MRFESGVQAGQLEEAAHHESGAGHQNHRDHDLDAHQDSAEATPAATGGDVAGVLPQLRMDIPEHLPRRYHAKDDTGNKR